jgi:hypothetical protein
MRRLLIGGLAVLTFATGALAPMAEAQARDGRYRYYHRHRDNDDDAWLAAGIAGLAIGAALASSSNRRDYGYYDYGPRRSYRYRYYDGPGYYRPSYGGYGGYYGRGGCRTTSYYDGWDGRYVERTRCW